MGKSDPGLLSHTHQQAGKLGTPTRPARALLLRGHRQSLREAAAPVSASRRSLFGAFGKPGGSVGVDGGMLEALCKSRSGSGLGSMVLHAIQGGQRQRPMCRWSPAPILVRYSRDVFFFFLICSFWFLFLFL